MCGSHPRAPLFLLLPAGVIARDGGKEEVRLVMYPPAVCLRASPGRHFDQGLCPHSSLLSLAPAPFPRPSHRRTGMVPCSDEHKVSHVSCSSLSTPFANSPFTKITSISQLERVLSLRILTASSQVIGEGCESCLDQDS